MEAWSACKLTVLILILLGPFGIVHGDGTSLGQYSITHSSIFTYIQCYLTQNFNKIPTYWIHTYLCIGCYYIQSIEDAKSTARHTNSRIIIHFLLPVFYWYYALKISIKEYVLFHVHIIAKCKSKIMDFNTHQIIVRFCANDFMLTYLFCY